MTKCYLNAQGVLGKFHFLQSTTNKGHDTHRWIRLLIKCLYDDQPKPGAVLPIQSRWEVSADTFGFSPDQKRAYDNAHLYPSKPTAVLLSDRQTLQEECEVYFSSVHLWFPIIHQSRFTEHSLPLLPTSSTVGATVLAMHLVNQRPDTAEPYGNMENQLYYEVKQLFNGLLLGAEPSLEILRCGILIALYEYGHGITDPAYLTVGTCARLGHVLGINQDPTIRLPKENFDWPEEEDAQRIWWGVLIADRYDEIDSMTLRSSLIGI